MCPKSENLVELTKIAFADLAMISIDQWRARIGSQKQGRSHDYLNDQCRCHKCLWKRERRPSDSQTREKDDRKSDGDSVKNATNTEKELVKPDMVGLHLQQNIYIPEISLVAMAPVEKVVNFLRYLAVILLLLKTFHTSFHLSSSSCSPGLL